MICASITAALDSGGCTMLPGTSEIGTQIGLTLKKEQLNASLFT